MVQPRKEQVKNLKTRHSKVAYSPVALDSYTDILDANMYSQVVSDTAGGVQQDARAIVRSTASEPYSTIFNGDSISIKIDANPSTTVTFTGDDITASRIAAAINTILGFDAALNDEGTLVLFSTLAGENAYIYLADTTGTLLKLGLTAGTYVGNTAPVRGIVTNEVNIESIGGSNSMIEGGFVSIRSDDGRVVTTDATSSSIVQFSSDLVRRIDVPGGMPIHGRIIRNPADTGYRISYYAKMPVEASAKTFSSNFSLLDGTDSLSIDTTVQYKEGSSVVSTAVPLTITFPSPTYDRDAVVSRINSVFATQVAGGLGAANVIGNIGQPFTLSSTDDILSITVEGGAPQLVTFLGSEITALDIVTRINTLTTGLTASVISTTGGNELIAIQSDENDGTVSSLDIQNNGTEDTLQKLGIVPGLYRGVFIAEAYGSEEILIKGIGRGSSSTLTIGGNAATLTRMGLVAGTYNGTNGGEVKVDFPVLNVITGYSVSLLVPEIVEYGEADLRVESILQEFDSNFGSFPGGKEYTTLLDGNFSGISRGLAEAGRPVFTNVLGQIDTSLTRAVSDDVTRTLKKFIIGDFSRGVNSVEKLVTSVLQTPGVDGNPGTKSRVLWIDVDPDAGASSGVQGVNFRFQRDNSPVTPFQLTKVSGFTNINWAYFLYGTTGIYNETDPLRLVDINTVQSGIANSGLKELPLTDNSAGRYPRVFEVEGNAVSQPSIIGKINAASWTVTVGDGTTSFGDFNGTNAIQQAITFYNTNVTGHSGFRIQCKPGVFVVDATNGPITIPDGITAIIEGIGANSNAGTVTISAEDQAEVINFAAPVVESTLILRDLVIETSAASAIFSDITVNGGRHFQAENVLFQLVSVKLKDARTCHLNKCNLYFNSTSADRAPIQFLMGDGSTLHDNFTFVDCTITAGDNNPAMSITAANSIIPETEINKIIYDRCTIYLKSTTTVANGPATYLAGNCGVIDLNPNGSSSRDVNEGITVKEIVWNNCNVNANISSSSISILIHLINYANGTILASLSDSWMDVEKVVINGGKWICPGTNTTHNPFTIAIEGEVVINNLIFGYESPVNHGAPTAELGYPFTGEFGVGGNIPAVAEWASMALFAWRLRIKNITFLNSGTVTNSGDLFIRWMDTVVEDVYIDNEAGGSGIVPEARVRFRPTVLSTGQYREGLRVRNVAMNGRLNTSVSLGAILYEPSDTGGIFENLHIFHHGGSGFVMLNAAGSSLYPSSLSSIIDLCLLNCNIRNCGVDGVNFDGVDSTVSGLRIIGGTFSNNGNSGVYIDGGSNLKSVTIEGTVCTGNGWDGISLYCSDWVVSVGRFCPIVMGNECYSNISNDIVFQGTTANDRTRGVCLGNNTADTLGAPGTIVGMKLDGGGLPQVLSSGAVNTTPSGVDMRGMETHFGDTTNGIPIAGTQFSDREWVDGSLMIYNYAYYKKQ